MPFIFRSIWEYGPEPASRRTGQINGMDQLDSFIRMFLLCLLISAALNRIYFDSLFCCFTFAIMQFGCVLTVYIQPVSVLLFLLVNIV